MPVTFSLLYSDPVADIDITQSFHGVAPLFILCKSVHRLSVVYFTC